MAVSVELNILVDYSRLYIINTFITFFLPSPVREVHFSCSLLCSFHVWNVTPQLLMAVIRPSRHCLSPSLAVLSINGWIELLIPTSPHKKYQYLYIHESCDCIMHAHITPRTNVVRVGSFVYMYDTSMSGLNFSLSEHVQDSANIVVF